MAQTGTKGETLAKGPGRQAVQVLSCLAASLCQAATGHCVPLSAYALPQLGSESGDQLSLSLEEGSWFASIFVIGSLTGSLVGGYQCDSLGRRLSMLVDCSVMAAGLLLITFAPSTIFLLIGRFLTGHSSGSNLVAAPIFVSEISHPDLRGTTSTLVMTCYTLGFFLSMLLGALLPWRTAVLVFTATPLISLVSVVFTKESPSWLLRKGRRQEAEASLLFYRGCKEVVRKELCGMEENLRGSSSSLPLLQKWSQLARLALTPQFLKPFLLLLLMLGVGLEWAGFPALAFYMHTLLTEIQLPFSVYWVAVCMGGYRSALVLSLSFIMYKAPRRPVYLGSGVLVALGGATLGGYSLLGPSLPSSVTPYTDYLPLLSMVIMYTGFALGWGPICFMLQGELFPAELRGFGCALLGILDNVSLFASVKLVPTLMANFGMGWSFLLYSGFCSFTLLVAAFAMPETKGMSLDEIEQQYRGELGQEPGRRARGRTISLSTI